MINTIINAVVYTVFVGLPSTGVILWIGADLFARIGKQSPNSL